MRKLFYCLALTMLTSSGYRAVLAATQPEFSNKDFTLRLVPRTPDQIGVIYSARGFPPAALSELRKTCFITLKLRNNSNTILWFDLSNWHFLTPRGRLHRILRSDWQQRWRTLALAQRLQSAFRQSLAPERLNFRPHEQEGGNITLPQTNQPITITGDIYVGKQKTRLYTIKFENIYCAGK